MHWRFWEPKATAVAKVETLSLRTKPFAAIEIVASVTTIILFFGAVLGLASDKTTAVWQVILVGWMCAMVTALLVILFVQERRTRRRFAYAVSLQGIHQVMHAVRDAEAAILQRDADQPEVVPMIATVLDAVASVFGTITGHECRACIKQVHFPTQDGGPMAMDPDGTAWRQLQVSTMVRDARTGRQPEDSQYQFVDQNTDFEDLILRRDACRWFLSNDLVAQKPYKSSTWSAAAPKKYLAAAVWPIQKLDPVEDKHDTLAFLCVDANAKQVFDSRFDFYVGGAIADALYPLLKLMYIQKLGGKPSDY